MSTQTNKLLDKKVATNIKTQRPANLSITVIKDDSCTSCYSLKNLIENIKKEKVKITKESTLKYDSKEAKNLISKHKINKLPALIINGEVEKTAQLKKIWTNLGESSSSTFILRRTGYPYQEVGTGKLRGLLNISLIDDKDCKKCYDVKQHLSILSNFGFPINSSTSYDSSSVLGSSLIKKYKITKLPTVVLTGDLKVYTGFDEIWKEVGTVENDGTYVFRDGLKQMNVVYMDLTTNKVVKPTTSTINN